MNFGKQVCSIFKRHSSTFSSEKGKKWAGIKAMESLIESKPSVIGLGSGSTIVYAIEHLAKTQIAKKLTCIPTSFQTRQLIIENNLILGSLEQYVNHPSSTIISVLTKI
jgi:ribose 5-phosphate isomerase A